MKELLLFAAFTTPAPLEFGAFDPPPAVLPKPTAITTAVTETWRTEWIPGIGWAQVRTVTESETKTVPGVTVAPSFRSGSRLEGHSCPVCGTAVYAKSGRGPERGTHWHVCPNPNCRTAWYHMDK